MLSGVVVNKLALQQKVTCSGLSNEAFNRSPLIHQEGQNNTTVV